MTASARHARSVDHLDTARSTPRAGGDGLRLGERVEALRDALVARTDPRATTMLRADVTAARGFVKGFNPRDDVSDKTASRYERAVNQLRATGRSPEDAACKTSFKFQRAALVHVTRAELKTALRDVDKHRRTGDERQASDAYLRVREGLATLRKYPPSTGSREEDMKRQSVYKGPTHPDQERSNGKRVSLDGLPATWRDDVQRETSPPDRAAVAAMALTGCRPVEVKGIRVNQNTDAITLSIRGAKVDDMRGVEARTVTLDRAELVGTQAGRDLLAWLGNREQRTVRHEGTEEAFAGRVSRAAERAGHSEVSAYSYRHQAARDLKSSGTPSEEIAERLGHRSDRSQSVYG